VSGGGRTVVASDWNCSSRNTREGERERGREGERERWRDGEREREGERPYFVLLITVQ